MIEKKKFHEMFPQKGVNIFDCLYFEMQRQNATLYFDEKELSYEIDQAFHKFHKAKETIATFKKRWFTGVIYLDNNNKFVGALLKKQEN